MKLFYYFLIIVGLSNACATPKKLAALQPGGLTLQGKLFASLYQQRAAEYHALCLQAYNIARLRTDESLKLVSTKPKAIITDIDETVLNNSAYAVHEALRGKDYEVASWLDWTGKALADTVPGAFSFLVYAASKGIEIFYITNREERERVGTLQNLKRYNFPFADDLHLLMKQNTSGKEVRRQQVMTGHEVVLLVGDNLSDFSSLYDKKSYEERLKATQQLAAEFGMRFIVLPNPVYGDWESAIYQYNYQLTPAQKDSVIIKSLKVY